ncbi:MAG: aspartate/glutamate racemase family protein [Bacillota bacterium]
MAKGRMPVGTVFKGGYTTYGIPLGILMLETVFPRIPGDVGNAGTFPFPGRYHVVPSPGRIPGSNDDSLEPLVHGARLLESGGVKAIAAGSERLAVHQDELRRAVSVPVFTSSLLQLPLVLQALNPRKKVGVLTAARDQLTGEHLRSTGLDPGDARLVIQGLENTSEFARSVLEDRPEADFGAIQAEVVSAAREMTGKEPEIGAFLFECASLCPYSREVMAKTKRPVYDLVTLCSMVYHSVIQRDYTSGGGTSGGVMV